MRPDERDVAGLTCSAVMQSLSDYLDGELPPPLVRQIEAHVAECRQCEQFGTGFSRLLQAMRRQMAEPDPVGGDVLERLRATLGGA